MLKKNNRQCFVLCNSPLDVNKITKCYELTSSNHSYQIVIMLSGISVFCKDR